MRYLASHQDVEMTRRRAHGNGVRTAVAELDGAIVGTIAIRPAGRDDGPGVLQPPRGGDFGQLAVEPASLGRGVAGIMLDWAEDAAAGAGASEIACDRAKCADGLIAMYRRRGHEIVAAADWRPVTNYRSVIPSKTVPAGRDAPRGAATS
jgi:GNAT superfamily N-acetyltransferase